eukprot:428267-Rhodomonas_salina.1
MLNLLVFCARSDTVDLSSIRNNYTVDPATSSDSNQIIRIFARFSSGSSLDLQIVLFRVFFRIMIFTVLFRIFVGRIFKLPTQTVMVVSEDFCNCNRLSALIFLFLQTPDKL